MSDIADSIRPDRDRVQQRQRVSRQELWRLLAPGLQTQWKRILAAAGCLLLSVVLRIVEPWPLRYVVDLLAGAIQSPESAGELSANVSGAEANVNQVILSATLAMVVIAVARALADFHRTLQFSMVGNRIVTDLRARVYLHVQSLSLRFHQQARGGDLTLRMVGDLNMMKD
ncbi:MAG: hypothetical protein KDA85_21685, partial [Planctomycetaceae bacterium]|nr:hypothetical protein [Planctomycetaceae bacterium]